MANTYKSKYTETSAALNHNVDELLVGILTQIRLKLQTQVKVSTSKVLREDLNLVLHVYLEETFTRKYSYGD